MTTCFVCRKPKPKILHFAGLVLFGAMAVLVTTSNAFANGYFVPGASHYSASTYDEWDSPDTIAVGAAVDNSYYCRALGFTGVDLVDFASTIAAPSGVTDPTLVYRGAADGAGNNEGAFSFIALGNGTHIINIASASFGTGSGSSALAIIECLNTTLFGNFNTVNAANPVNFLELKNISDVSLDALVILRNFSGTELTRFTRTIPAGQRQDIGLQDISGVTNTFGSIQVAHTGPVGSLVGNLSKYTFDGVTLSITATEPLKERVSR